MAGDPVEWFTGTSLGSQSLVLAAAFDSLGAVAGVLLATQSDLRPIFGTAIGLFVGSVPLYAWTARVAVR